MNSCCAALKPNLHVRKSLDRIENGFWGNKIKPIATHSCKNSRTQSRKIKKLEVTQSVLQSPIDEEMLIDPDGDGHEMEGLISPRVSIPRLLRTASTGLLRSFSRKNVDSSMLHVQLNTNNSTILYSDSNGLRKPPDMVKRLECTLEELCFGCIKKVNITRDVLTNDGHIVQEEEVLKINIKPGWKKGTQITFEGMGNQTSPTCTADITLVIDEKRHPVFKRNGDDLEVAVELPLVDALIGCKVPIPFLDGQESCFIIDDEVITPGYTKSIEGEGMPLPKEQGKRGNLNIKFSVQFPQNLTEEQRSECFNILQDSC